MNGDELAAHLASLYRPPHFPVLNIGPEMDFLGVPNDISAKWHVVDDLCAKHLACIGRRLVLLKTVRNLWITSYDSPSNNSPEALSGYEEISLRKSLFDKVDDSIVSVPIRVLETLVNQFMRLAAHWNDICVPNDVSIALKARAYELTQISNSLFLF